MRVGKKKENALSPGYPAINFLPLTCVCVCVCCGWRRQISRLLSPEALSWGESYELLNVREGVLMNLYWFDKKE